MHLKAADNVHETIFVPFLLCELTFVLAGLTVIYNTANNLPLKWLKFTTTIMSPFIWIPDRLPFKPPGEGLVLGESLIWLDFDEVLRSKKKKGKQNELKTLAW